MAADTQREVESKFDVAPDFAMPELAPLLRGGGSIDVSTVHLVSTYFDSAGCALFRSGLTLRQRSGQADTGWHLKVPGDGFRTELRWPLPDSERDGADRVPDELLALIRPFFPTPSPAEPISPIARLRTRRTRHCVLDAAGGLRIEIADDDVRVDALDQPVQSRRWREVEAELGPAGSTKDLARAAALLVTAEAEPSQSSSKLAHALHGLPLPAPAGSNAGEVVRAYLDRQCDALVAGHFAVSMTELSDPGTEPDENVHEMRVAARRLRATLRSFGDIFTGEAQSLDAELSWLATELGTVRDCQVLKVRLRTAIDELPSYLVIGPVAERIEQILDGELATRAEQLRATMASSRYSALLQALARWRSDPPLTARAALPSAVLANELAAASQRLERLIKRMANPQAAETDLHRTRRAAKRSRYAGEALKPALGQPARDLVHRATAVQTALGEYQDAVITTDTLRHLADQAAQQGESSFTYGVLVADQRRAAADAARYAMML